jgi:hypothetical protein
MGKRRRQLRSDGSEPEVSFQNRIGSSAYECIRYPKPGMESLDKAPHNENSEEIKGMEFAAGALSRAGVFAGSCFSTTTHA